MAYRQIGMNRVVVVGTSGSGKTTIARRLAAALDVPHLEMDSVFHRDGLANVAHDQFLPILDRFTASARWVVDGNYTSHGTREVVWPKVDTFVWLDPPRLTAMTRVVRRTLRRVLTREEIWLGVREPFSNLYSFDPYKNIIVWAWTHHGSIREKYKDAMWDGSWAHATAYRLRSSSEIETFLESVASDHK